MSPTQIAIMAVNAVLQILKTMALPHVPQEYQKTATDIIATLDDLWAELMKHHAASQAAASPPA
jgi:predicted Zn-dependent protease with MMP-like domain